MNKAESELLLLLLLLLLLRPRLQNSQKVKRCISALKNCCKNSLNLRII